MKKLLIICTAAAMLLVPAIAEAGGRHGGHRGGNDWIGPVIFGTVLGIIIASNSHDNKTVIVQERRGPRHYRRHHHPRYRWVEVCERVGYVKRRRHYSHRHADYRVECHMVRKAVW